MYEGVFILRAGEFPGSNLDLHAEPTDVTSFSFWSGELDNTLKYAKTLANYICRILQRKTVFLNKNTKLW
jgi:hypothetical protein